MIGPSRIAKSWVKLFALTRIELWDGWKWVYTWYTHTALQKRWQFSEEQLDPLTKSESRALVSLIASDYCICLVQCLTSTAPCWGLFSIPLWSKFPQFPRILPCRRGAAVMEFSLVSTEGFSFMPFPCHIIQITYGEVGWRLSTWWFRCRMRFVLGFASWQSILSSPDRWYTVDESFRGGNVHPTSSTMQVF